MYSPELFKFLFLFFLHSKKNFFLIGNTLYLKNIFLALQHFSNLNNKFTLTRNSLSSGRILFLSVGFFKQFEIYLELMFIDRWVNFTTLLLNIKHQTTQFVANHGIPRTFPGKVFHFVWNTVPQPVAKRSFSLSDPGTFTYPMPMALIDSSSQWATR